MMKKVEEKQKHILFALHNSWQILRKSMQIIEQEIANGCVGRLQQGRGVAVAKGWGLTAAQLAVH